MDAIRARAWWLLVAISVLIGLFGLSDVAIGATADPGIPQGLTGRTPAELEAESELAYRMFDFTSRGQGLLLVAFGVVLTALLVIPYRRGEPWAWYVAWVLPAWALAIVGLYAAFGLAPGQAPPPPTVSGPIIALIAAGALLLDRRRVFRAS